MELFWLSLLSLAIWTDASLSTLPQIRWAESNPMIVTEEVEYTEGSAVFRGFTARHILFTNVRPVVVLVPGKDGRNNFTDEKAVQLAELGYLGFVVDLFGNDTLGYSTPPAKYVYEYDYLKNRTKLFTRMKSAVELAKGLDYADPFKVKNFIIIYLISLSSFTKSIISFGTLTGKNDRVNYLLFLLPLTCLT